MYVCGVGVGVCVGGEGGGHKEKPVQETKENKWNTVPFQGGEHTLHLQIGNNKEIPAITMSHTQETCS